MQKEKVGAYQVSLKLERNELRISDRHVVGLGSM